MQDAVRAASSDAADQEWADRRDDASGVITKSCSGLTQANGE